MKCPYCENGPSMKEEQADFDSTQDIIEIILRCLHCGEVFHGTLYRGTE